VRNPRKAMLFTTHSGEISYWEITEWEAANEISVERYRRERQTMSLAAVVLGSR
jgi:hypothetical protein